MGSGRLRLAVSGLSSGGLEQGSGMAAWTREGVHRTPEVSGVQDTRGLVAEAPRGDG